MYIYNSSKYEQQENILDNTWDVIKLLILQSQLIMNILILERENVDKRGNNTRTAGADMFLYRPGQFASKATLNPIRSNE